MKTIDNAFTHLIPSMGFFFTWLKLSYARRRAGVSVFPSLYYVVHSQVSLETGLGSITHANNHDMSWNNLETVIRFVILTR